MQSLAVLGGNGQIGLDVARVWLERGLGPVDIFSRRPNEAEKLISGWLPVDIDDAWHRRDYSELFDREYDLIINAVGNGRFTKWTDGGTEFAAVSRAYDDLCRDYLMAYPQTLCGFVSSGIVYGTDSVWPVENTASILSAPDDTSNAASYLRSKLEIEARHRALTDLNFYDIRVFGWFSRHIALQDSFFLSEVATAWIDNMPLVTGPGDMLRDYISGPEFVDLLCGLLAHRPHPGPIDLCSRAPTTKWELLGTLEERGLNVDCADVPEPFDGQRPSPSNLGAARAAGYFPKRNSIQVVLTELEYLRAAAMAGIARRIS